MNEIDFKNWLSQNGTKKKIQNDYISRLKRIERELNQCDIDIQYKKDRCNNLMLIFLNKGKNIEFENIHTNLPVGKYYISTYRLALKKYIQFLDNFNSNNK